jgi:drug/metabolite transporter (DMT)-like permease
MGWLFFRESPATAFYAASALVVAGIVIVILNSPPQPRLR